MEAIHFIQDLAVILVVPACGLGANGSGSRPWSAICGRLWWAVHAAFALVTDVPRVETLAQLGLVFLMFSLGLRLSLRKLQRLGLSLMLAVAVSAG